MGGRPARPAAAGVGRVRDRRADGELHRSGRRRCTRCWPGTGWDLGAAGLWGAPRVRVLAGRAAARHDRPRAALPRRRHRGDRAGGRRRPGPDAASTRSAALALDDRPAIVCAQVGNVNTGAVDPVGEISDVAHRHGAWVHVDGAFGLWAAASPRLRHAGRRAWSGPTRGRPTRTSGSTCPTTAALVVLRRPAGAPGGDGRAGRLPRPRRGRRARRAGLQPRALPPGPRVRGVRGAARAGPARASPSWSSAAARWPAGSPSSSARPRASRC